MRYFIGFLISIGLIILLIILIIGGGGDKKAKKVPVTQKPLYSYATSDSSVVMTIDGPVVANKEHRQVRVTVTNSQVTYEQINGYDGSIVNTKTYGNTQKSYETFLRALTAAGFTDGDNDASLKDERGYCATDNRYIFELKQSGKDLTRYWTSDCGKPRTFEGDSGAVMDLFKAQVPDYGDLTTDVDNI